MGYITKRFEAIKYLRQQLPSSEKVKIRSLITKHGSKDWVHHLYDDEIAALTDAERAGNMAAFWKASGHCRFGMSVRNELRDAGFGEDELGVDNIDDIYIYLLNEAVTA